jgi:hypothetical protein
MTLLAKLSPGSMDWRGLPGGSGPEITAADVAGALSYITDITQLHLLLAIGADQWPNSGQHEQVIQDIQNMIVRAWLKGGGRNRLNREKVRPMAELAWIEATGKTLTETQRSEAVEVSRAAWDSSYRYVYSAALAELEALLHSGMRTIKRRIGRF